MSLLTRLGRTDGKNLQVMIFSSRKGGETNIAEDRAQNLKLMIHRKIVEEITPEEQRIISAKNMSDDDLGLVNDIIDKYFKRVLETNPYAVPLGERTRLVTVPWSRF